MEELLRQLIDYAGESYRESQFDLMQTLLNDALEDVCGYMYPRGFDSDDEKTRVEAVALQRYPGKIRRIAQYHYDKIGKSGLQEYTDNGVSGVYEASDTPVSLLRGIIPIAKVV